VLDAVPVEELSAGLGRFAGTVAFVAALLVGGWAIYWLGKRAIGRIAVPAYARRREATRRLETTRTLLVQLWKFTLLVVVGVVLLARMPSGQVPSMALATGLGFTIALALGVPLLKDLVPGFQMLREAQYFVGDRVRLHGVDSAQAEGVVEAVGLRVTVVRKDDGSRLFMPNGSVTAVENLSTARRIAPGEGLDMLGSDLRQLALGDAGEPSGAAAGAGAAPAGGGGGGG
jgi:small-conductance mechanosensitive channel